MLTRMQKFWSEDILMLTKISKFLAVFRSRSWSRRGAETLSKPELELLCASFGIGSRLRLRLWVELKYLVYRYFIIILLEQDQASDLNRYSFQVKS
jgi:hypothetical protein